MTRRVRVLVSGELAGFLEEVPPRGSRFTYAAEWLARDGARPVSLTLPLRVDPYDDAGLHPFFENLLPEGWLLQISTLVLQLSKDDAFGLLLATCSDCIGDVEILPDEGSST